MPKIIAPELICSKSQIRTFLNFLKPFRDSDLRMIGNLHRLFSSTATATVYVEGVQNLRGGFGT